MTVTKAAAKTALVLVGRKTQYIAGIGITRRGKAFGVSEDHAQKLLKAKNRATGDYLYLREETYREQVKRDASATTGDDALDLGLVEKGTPKGGAVDIEEV